MENRPMEKYIMFPLSCCSVNIKRVCICLNKKVYFCSTSWSVHNPEGEERQGEKERQEREEERRGGGGQVGERQRWTVVFRQTMSLGDSCPRAVVCALRE